MCASSLSLPLSPVTSSSTSNRKMLGSSSPEFSHNSLKIKKDDKFFSRLLSKENSMANPSFRVYYGNVSSAVPFTWEIQPGTPKHKFSDNSIPPLTPPPSYYTSTHSKPTKRKYYPRSKLLHKILLNINPIKKGQVASSSPSSLSSSSWSSSMSSSGPSSRRRRFMSCGSSFDDGGLDDRHVYGGGSPDSVMCFGMNKNKSCDIHSNGGGTAYTVVIMKKALLSIVGRRSC